ncbi:unnamed protein product [Parnassius apollo]|uniref:(apollo) hypothetical protein n=1 Tax=Parnassius apollo TaxID=110799 RepID=A0A8S3XHM2_PARAO|nr:unnamed protein product [Parnassius apollo]
MARSGVAALSIAILLTAFEFGSCLRCFQCNSQSDPTCKDPFAGKTRVDCSTQDSVNYNRAYLRGVLPNELVDAVAGAPRYCHKIVMQNGATIRTCLDANPTDLNQTCRLLDNTAKMFPMDPAKQIKHCSVCDRDDCNGASSIIASFPLAALALIASYLFYKQ